MKYSFKKFFFAASIFLFLFDFSSCVIEPRPFYLTYESKYGIVPEKKKIPVNTVLTEKELPTLYSEDHTFKGWYEEGIKAVIAKFTDLINNDGKVESVNEKRKKRLAYEIMKNKEGFYVVFNFEAKPELIAELERNYRIDDSVMKFITIKKED